MLAHILAQVDHSAEAAGFNREVLDAYAPLLTLALGSAQAVQIPAPDEPEGWALEAMEQAMEVPMALQFQVTSPDREVVLTAAVGSGSVSWLIEALRPALRQWPCAVEWLPGFSRCLAWCWLERRAAIKAASVNAEWCGGAAKS